jgi:RNA polymerase sigma-70 factor (ECF subfamily)
MTPEEAKAADRKVIEAIRAGDTGAYRELVERYQGRVFAMICGMVRDREEARDITQESFIKAYRNLDRFRLDSSFYTWLYRIAMNCAIDLLRRRKVRRHSEFNEEIGQKDSSGMMDDSHSKMNPGKDLERKRLRKKIFAALDELSEDHRQILVLREIEGLSYEEIGETMEIPEGTVMSRLFYARRKMQSLLGGKLEAV